MGIPVWYFAYLYANRAHLGGSQGEPCSVLCIRVRKPSTFRGATIIIDRSGLTYTGDPGAPGTSILLVYGVLILRTCCSGSNTPMGRWPGELYYIIYIYKYKYILFLIYRYFL